MLTRPSTSRAFAVLGASNDRSKFGSKVFRWYLDHGLGDATVPVNPKDAKIEDVDAVKSLDELPDEPQRSVSIITPPKVTLGVLQAAAAKREDWRYWCQPGSTDAQVEELIQNSDSLRDRVVCGGPCILVIGEQLLSAQRKAQL